MSLLTIWIERIQQEEAKFEEKEKEVKLVRAELEKKEEELNLKMKLEDAKISAVFYIL